MKDENDVKCRLQEFAKRAVDLMQLVGNQENRFENKQEIQHQFKNLKKDLEAEYKRLYSAELSELEERFYKPAIDDAWANSPISSIRWNSQPDNRWFGALDDVDDSMTYWICALEQYFDQIKLSG